MEVRASISRQLDRILVSSTLDHIRNHMITFGLLAESDTKELVYQPQPRNNARKRPTSLFQQIQLNYSYNYNDNDVTGINLTVDWNYQFLNERTFSIDMSAIVVTLSSETSNILNDDLVKSDSFATHVIDEANAVLNNSNGTSFIDSTNCVICTSVNTTGLCNLGFELSEIDVSTNVTMIELDSARRNNGIGNNSNGIAIIAIVFCMIVGVIFLFILGIVPTIHYKENKNNRDSTKKNNKKENTEYIVSDDDTQKQELDAVSPSGIRTLGDLDSALGVWGCALQIGTKKSKHFCKFRCSCFHFMLEMLCLFRIKV